MKKAKDDVSQFKPNHVYSMVRNVPEYSRDFLERSAGFVKRGIGKISGSFEAFFAVNASLDVPMLYYLIKPSLFPSPLNEVAYVTAEGVSLALTAHGIRRSQKE